ncbi:hypothetical protein [Bradyrhizobium cenepequi]
MDRYVARANIDKYLDILNGVDVAAANRAVVVKLLIEEEDKLGHHLEQLEFAEMRVAKGKNNLVQARRSLEALADDSALRAQAERLVTNLEETLRLMEDFCDRIRTQVLSRSL